MSNQWLRAFRFVAQNPRRRCLLSLPPTPTAIPTTTRLFHATGLRRASNDSDNEPRDDGRKPGSGASKGIAETAEENVPGENVAALNGENQGRRRTNGLRSRTLRNRKSDLPPVQIPESFFRGSIDRHGDLVNASFKAETAGQHQGNADKRDTAADIKSSLRSNLIQDLWEDHAWDEAAIQDAIESLSTSSDGDYILRRTQMIGVSAYWAIVNHIATAPRPTTSNDLPKTNDVPRLKTEWVTALLQHTTDFPTSSLCRPGLFDDLLSRVVDTGEIPINKAALFEPYMIDELVTAIRAELFIQAPEDIKLANLRRPVTIFDVQDCSGFSVAQNIVQYAACKVGADVLHLRAHDIAHIVGRYIGQDITRSPGDISLLGFKAAENCGRLRSSSPVEDHHEDGVSFDVPITVMLRDAKMRKDAKRQTLSMEEFLMNSGTRGKSEDLWEDMKVNTAIDELINAARTDAAEQKPLIIHINDYNALNMDETGAELLAKIRKNVDDLWSSGRKVVIVGSCSSRNAPKAYHTALATLEKIDRVVHIVKCRFDVDDAHTAAEAVLDEWEKEDYLRENDENIVRMLWSMTESSDSASTNTDASLNLAIYADDVFVEPDMEQMLPKYWSGVLPIMEVYRIATAMIGLSSTTGPKLFTRSYFNLAIAQMANVDAARERALKKAKSSLGSTAAERLSNILSSRRADPLGGGQEERLLSGLINAQDIRTTFKDIHAPAETMESIKMLTTLSLVRPEAFTYGVLASERIPGCLLYGPPGTGKTLLAKAVAKESGANMIEVSGASINNMYLGESEKNVRALFQLAKKKEPMVIFIDEADALLGARGGPFNASRRDTINQFLREWDGMDRTKAFIMVATNRPFDLDEAVLRRLPRKLLIDLPLETDRAAILRIHLKDELMDETVSIEDLAKRTPLYSGSDLKNVCVAAAMAAVKEELEASERHTGPEVYQWAAKRILNARHFDKALKEIGASVSEDMATLTAIRKFDERYGDSKARRKRKGMGFEVVPEVPDSDQARVRSAR